MSHLEVLKKMISSADDIYVVVAFLKLSGLSLIINDLNKVLERNGAINLIVGLDLYVTDAEALYVLYDLKQKYKKINFHLYKSINSTFHPKIYCAKGANSKSVLLGSANLTNGGMISNTEASIYYEDDQIIYDQAVSYYQEIINSTECSKASHLKISKYEEECAVFTRELKKANKIAEKLISSSQNLSLVMKCYKEYCEDHNEMINLQKKREHYKEAKKLIKKINPENIKNIDDFIAIYERLVGAAGMGQLWHSGSIFRSKNTVAKSYKKFIKLVDIATDKKILNEPVEIVFNRILPFKESIKGLGFNVITEMLNTLAPNKFPVLNKNPIGSVKYIWGKEFKDPSSFDSKDYKSYTEFMKKLSNEIGAEDFIETDHFLNYIYWKYAKAKHNKPIIVPR